MNESSDIYYDEFGAPHIKGNKISISHSSEITAIIVSPYEVGVDIQKISPKTLAISTKFISENTAPSEKGITTHEDIARKKVRIGAKINKNLLELLGRILSFKNNLRPSARA